MKKSASMESMRQDGVAHEGLGHLFVMDKLTSNSPPTGLGGSVLQSKMGASMGGQQKPISKFDAQTGKFYRSFKVDTSQIEAASLGEMMTLFAGSQLDYSSEQHAGVVLSLAGGEANVICVGDTHVHCNFLFDEAKAKLTTFLTLHAAANAVEEQILASEACGMTLFHSAANPDVEDEEDFMGKAHSMAGWTFFSAGPAEQSSGPITEIANQVAGLTLFSPVDGVEPSELVAEESAGISLFAPCGKAKDHMIADSVGGFTLLSYADDALSENDTEEGSNADAEELSALEDDDSAALSNKDLKALWTSVASTCAGLTFFSPAHPTRTEEEWESMQADCVGGMTLFA